MPDPEGIAILARKPAEALAGMPRSPSLPLDVPRDRSWRRRPQPPSSATASPAHTLALRSALAQAVARNDSPGVLTLEYPPTDPAQNRSQEQNRSQQSLTGIPKTPRRPKPGARSLPRGRDGDPQKFPIAQAPQPDTLRTPNRCSYLTPGGAAALPHRHRSGGKCLHGLLGADADASRPAAGQSK
jgi:hypothetical protein